MSYGEHELNGTASMMRNGHCFNCGEWGHFARDRAGNWTCPYPAVDAHTPQPDSDSYPYPRYVRPTGPRANGKKWLDRIFAEQGWERKLTAEERAEAERQEAARRQAAESRRERDSEHAA